VGWCGVVSVVIVGCGGASVDGVVGCSSNGEINMCRVFIRTNSFMTGAGVLCMRPIISNAVLFGGTSVGYLIAVLAIIAWTFVYAPFGKVELDGDTLSVRLLLPGLRRIPTRCIDGFFAREERLTFHHGTRDVFVVATKNGREIRYPSLNMPMGSSDFARIIRSLNSCLDENRKGSNDD
jgi:hypothetical protein